ncbi:MAG: conserved rane protein of unknown function [Pseudonocardiales bacterium]|nr:conserved rane protein of unknown function [Pseudonocardiales bacterium]
MAALVLCLQALGLVIATLVLLIKTLTGHPDSLGRALFGAAFALGGAALLVYAARSFRELRTFLRTPVIVVELLALPVGWSLGFQAGRVLYAAPLLISAVAVLYLLFTPAGRQALERRL